MTNMNKNEDNGRRAGGQKSREGGRGDPDKASPAAVERYLKGIKFPANKEKLTQQAKSNNAPSDVLSVISRMEDKEYNSPVDVAKEVGNVE